jgi:vacuolar-type H+-ATPase subunit H
VRFNGKKLVTKTAELIEEVKKNKSHLKKYIKDLKEKNYSEVKQFKNQLAYERESLRKKTKEYQDNLVDEYRKSQEAIRLKLEAEAELGRLKEEVKSLKKEKAYNFNDLDEDYLKIIDIIYFCHSQMFDHSREYRNEVEKRGEEVSPSVLLELIIKAFNANVAHLSKKLVETKTELGSLKNLSKQNLVHKEIELVDLMKPPQISKSDHLSVKPNLHYREDHRKPRANFLPKINGMREKSQL